jgi:F-type H+-transporting ATPase subunit delta
MSSRSSSVVEQYARALLEVLEARPERERSQCEAEIGELAEAVEGGEEIRRFLGSPAIDSGRKKELLLESLAGAHALTRRFVEVVADRGRADLLPEVRAAYERLKEERQGVLVAEVTSARPLTSEARQRCAEALKKATGHPVRLSEKVDAELIGGARTQIGSQVFDSSVRGQLGLLRRKLLGD